jgi:hypothetical protein
VSCVVYGARAVKATPDSGKAVTSAEVGGKPALLMLSHCVPQPSETGGEPERARAWALLRLVSQSHRVFLVCVHDGPVRLEDWRALRGHAHRVTIESAGILRRVLARTIGLFDPQTGRSVQMKRDLSHPIASWAAEIEFDAVLCTHSGLWHFASAVRPRIVMCDAAARPGSPAGSLIVLPDGLIAGQARDLAASVPLAA